MPARTRRGRNTSPCTSGAEGTADCEAPAHVPVSAQ